MAISSSGEAPPAPDRVLDVKGLDCPLPILRTKLLLGELAAGEVLHVIATDPHSVLDFRAYCARTGHELLAVHEDGETFEFFLRRKA